jgi:hypothetical protein
MKIETRHDPDGFWSAIDADNYEAESDSERTWSTSPQGYGDTEIEAVRDLLEQIEEQIIAGRIHA